MKSRKPIKNKGLKAYIWPETDYDSPFGWSSAVPLYKESQWSNVYKGSKGERLWMFCNNRFDPDRFENMDFDSDDAMCKYLSHFGCLAVPFYGGPRNDDGILVMSSEDIPKGYKSRKDAKGHLEGIADMYYRACEGEVYGLTIVDTPGTEDDLIPEYVDHYPFIDYDEGEEDVFSCGGYFGQDHVENNARDEMEYIIAQRSKSKSRKSKVKPKAKKKARR